MRDCRYVFEESGGDRHAGYGYGHRGAHLFAGLKQSRDLQMRCAKILDATSSWGVGSAVVGGQRYLFESQSQDKCLCEGFCASNSSAANKKGVHPSLSGTRHLFIGDPNFFLPRNFCALDFQKH